MAGNIININNSKDFEWYVGDSKMHCLITLLDTIGVKTSDPSYTGQPESKDSQPTKKGG